MSRSQNSDYVQIASINIESNRHFDRVIPFLKEKQPDIVLLQEVFERDISFLEKTLEMKSSFAILNTFRGIENSKFGLLSLSALHTEKTYSVYYRGNPAAPPEIGPGEAANQARAILVTEFVKNEKRYCAINTHFTWTPDGHPSSRQYEDIDIMLGHLANIPEFILCGDFNAPRGRPIFDKIASKYKDNIPEFITTTIDANFHRAGALNLVVDGMFTTPKYRVDSLEVVSGLSDHCGILAKVFMT